MARKKSTCEENSIEHKCALCPYSTKILQHYKRHMKIHSSDKPFKCPECPFKSKWKESVKQHVKNVHLLQSESSRPFLCPHPGCSFAAKQKSNLSKHEKVHSSHKSFVCTHPDCNYSTNYKSHLIRHTRRHTGEKTFVCQFESCSYASAHLEDLQTHSRTHTKERPYKCSELNCEYSTAYSSHLSRHRRDHHREGNMKEGEEERPSFSCSIEGCPFTTWRRQSLKRHLVAHSDSFFKCDICPFHTRWKESLQKHVERLHNSDPDGKAPRPFKCQEPKCDYAAKEKSALTKHLLIHKKEKKYSCSFPDCDYKAHEERSVRRHQMAFHETEKRVKCTLCDFATKTKKSLVGHVRTHTKEEPFVCPEKSKGCEYRAKQASGLREHVKKHHPEIFKS